MAKGQYSTGKSRTEPKLDDQDVYYHQTVVKPTVKAWRDRVMQTLGYTNQKQISDLIGRSDILGLCGTWIAAAAFVAQ